MNNTVISTRLHGGPGNMLFQTSFVIALSMKNNCNYELKEFYNNCSFNASFLGRQADWKNNLFTWIDVDTQYNNLEQINHCSLESIPFCFVDFSVVENTKNFYDGYFQSEKFFYGFNDQIRSLWYPSKQTTQQLIEKYQIDFSEYTAISVRRGEDYLKTQDHHPVVTEKYINNGIDFFGSDSKYLFFSDDINWCKEKYHNLKNVLFAENERDFNQLYMMSQCSNFIISNSTFSWWGAWLSIQKEKKVLYPEKWFGPSLAHLETKDLCPENWLPISE